MTANEITQTGFAGFPIQTEDTELNEAQRTLEELDIAADTTLHLLDDKTEAEKPISQETARAIAASRREDNRERAKRYRESGKRSLERRYGGVMSIEVPVKINERPIGDQFHRFFAGMENALYVLYKMGHIYLPKEQLDAVKATVEERLAKLEKSLESATASSATLQQIHKGSEKFIPDYCSPTVEMVVQLRTRHANRLLDVFVGFDGVLKVLHTLAWYGEYDDSDIRIEQEVFRDELREIGQLLARTAKGMRNRAMEGVFA